MFLHIGVEKEINVKNIIIILDYESINKSIINEEYIRLMNKNIRILNKEESTKSIVIVNEEGNNILYFSPITSLTLQKRMLFIKA